MSTETAGGFLTSDDQDFLNGASDFEIGTGGIDSGALDSGGAVDLEGQYHFEVSDVKPELETVNESGNPRTPSVLFSLTVLETVPGQSPKGCKLFHRIYVGSKGGGPAAEGSVKSMIVFGKGLGLLKDVEQGGKKVAVDVQSGQAKITLALWMRAKGLQCIGKVEKEEDPSGQYKPRFSLGFGRVHQPNDPRVASVPKNAEALKMIGMTAPVPQQQQPNQQATQSQAEQQPAGQSAPMTIDDL